MQLTYQAPFVELTQLENLWFQLSNISCNIKCKHCYLDCHQDTKKKNFLKIERIKETLKENLPKLERIFLTGGEPFLHPQINEIIKLTLNKADITIYSNGTLLSEKRIKIIKDIENKTQRRITFRLSLDHFTEGRNDEYRARGVFKKVINALNLLQKYEFKTEIICVNLKNEDEKVLKEGFCNLCKKNAIEITPQDIRIVPLLKMDIYDDSLGFTEAEKVVTFEKLKDFDIKLLDCQNARVQSINGVFSCPALVNDPRGKLGENITNASKKVYLETAICYNCVHRADKLFG